MSRTASQAGTRAQAPKAKAPLPELKQRTRRSVAEFKGNGAITWVLGSLWPFMTGFKARTGRSASHNDVGAEFADLFKPAPGQTAGERVKQTLNQWISKYGSQYKADGGVNVAYDETVARTILGIKQKLDSTTPRGQRGRRAEPVPQDVVDTMSEAINLNDG